MQARAPTSSAGDAGDPLPELPPLTDHASFLLFPFRVPPRERLREASLTLQDCLRGPDGRSAGDRLPWLRPEEGAAVLAGDRVTRMWDPAPFEVGGDVHPHVRRMLGAEDVRSADRTALTFRLADLPLSLLQGKSLLRRDDPKGGGRRRLELELSAAARTRLAARSGGVAPERVEVSIDAVRLAIFRTRFAVIMVELSLRHPDGAPISAGVLLEAVNSLARFNTLRWTHDPRSPAGPPSAAFTLSGIVASLHDGEAHGSREHRVFTATYAQFASAPDPDARQRFAIQLARHYSDQYRIAPTIGGIRTVADFRNVTHVMSLEGSATIVDLAPPAGLPTPEFLTTFKTATFVRHYLPIMVLGFHEFVTLLHFSNDAKFWAASGREDRFAGWAAQTGGAEAVAPSDKERGEAYAKLERLRDDMLRFRLCYRFSDVSFVSMHNAVYEAMRAVWGLDRMHAELGRDTAEISSFLEEVTVRENARKVRWLGVAGATGLAFLSGYAVAEKVVPMVPWLSGNAAKIAEVTFSIAIAAVAWCVTWIRTRPPHGAAHGHDLGHDLAEHAMDDEVLHALTKKRPEA